MIGRFCCGQQGQMSHPGVENSGKPTSRKSDETWGTPEFNFLCRIGREEKGKLNICKLLHSYV